LGKLCVGGETGSVDAQAGVIGSDGDALGNSVGVVERKVEVEGTVQSRNFGDLNGRDLNGSDLNGSNLDGLEGGLTRVTLSLVLRLLVLSNGGRLDGNGSDAKLGNDDLGDDDLGYDDLGDVDLGSFELGNLGDVELGSFELGDRNLGSLDLSNGDNGSGVGGSVVGGSAVGRSGVVSLTRVANRRRLESGNDGGLESGDSGRFELGHLDLGDDDLGHDDLWDLDLGDIDGVEFRKSDGYSVGGLTEADVLDLTLRIGELKGQRRQLLLDGARRQFDVEPVLVSGRDDSDALGNAVGIVELETHLGNDSGVATAGQQESRKGD